jgi:hypothetical protein
VTSGGAGGGGAGGLGGGAGSMGGGLGGGPVAGNIGSLMFELGNKAQVYQLAFQAADESHTLMEGMCGNAGQEAIVSGYRTACDDMAWQMIDGEEPDTESWIAMCDENAGTSRDPIAATFVIVEAGFGPFAETWPLIAALLGVEGGDGDTEEQEEEEENEDNVG